MIKSKILPFIFLLFVFSIFSCTKEETQVASTATSTTSSNQRKATTNTLAIRGINWADPNGNEGDGRDVIPSGLDTTMTTSQAAAVGKRIADAVKVSGGTTIRMPINYWTSASTKYWPVYKAAIDAIVADGCKVILCYWPVTGHIVSNSAQWYYMWTQVDNAYKTNANVLYEPINEPVGYSASDLCNLYAAFLSYYSPTANKCILDGTGYASDVLAVGADSRLSSQYLGLHCYWWFWGSYNVWSSAYSKMSSLVGSYASRTVVTEIGVETFRTFDFWWQWQTGAEPDVAFLTGSLSYAKDNSIGTIAWSGVNDIDTYRWYQSNSNLVEVNPGCANMFRWSWGLSSIWIGPKANGTYKLKNRATGLYLDSYGLTASPSSVYQYTTSTSSNQKWEITYVNGYYTIYALGGGLCLDANTNTADGSAIQQLSRGTSNSQQWTISLASTGYYKIINKNTGKCLDTGGLTASGSPLQQWYSGSSYNQQWVLELQ